MLGVRLDFAPDQHHSLMFIQGSGLALVRLSDHTQWEAFVNSVSKKPLILLAILAMLVFPACAAVTGLTGAGAPQEVPARQVVVQAQVTEAPESEDPAVPIGDGGVLAAYQGALERVYREVNPSVVSINTRGTSQSLELPEDHPEFFDQAAGSGFIWDTDGHIVTNNHVIETAGEIDVIFSDGSVVQAEVVGTDPYSDLAVLQVDRPADQLVPIRLGISDEVNVGQLAIAIGNPFNFSGTMTVGIISAVERSLPVGNPFSGSRYSIPGVLQTDAPINPGNSGGVLVNVNGELIGVPTAIESPVRANAGIGFAVPAGIVSKVVPALIETGAYQHPWLGLSGVALTPGIAEAAGLPIDQRGVLVQQVIAGSPSEQGGVQGSDEQATVDGVPVGVGGDVIIAIDGEPVHSMDDVISYLASETQVGQTVTLTVLRDRQETTVEVTLGARPAMQDVPLVESQPETPGPFDLPQAGVRLGIQGESVTPAIAESLGLPEDTRGVLVQTVLPDTPAAAAGLETGDVIVAWDGQALDNMETLRTLLDGIQPGEVVTFSVLRNGEQVEVTVTFPTR